MPHCKIDKDWEVILITLLMPFAFLSLSLGNPTRGRQLFTPERMSRDEGGCRKRENLTRKTTKRHWSSPYFKGAAVFFFFFLISPLAHRHFLLFPCHSPSSSREVWDIAEMQYQHASPSQQPRVRKRGVEGFTYVDQRVASCQRGWLKFLGPRMQGVMYDEQVVWV